jgi:hypothetical protein
MSFEPVEILFVGGFEKGRQAVILARGEIHDPGQVSGVIARWLEGHGHNEIVHWLDMLHDNALR